MEERILTSRAFETVAYASRLHIETTGTKCCQYSLLTVHGSTIEKEELVI